MECWSVVAMVNDPFSILHHSHYSTTPILHHPVVRCDDDEDEND
jgi:hypothetical protein